MDKINSLTYRFHGRCITIISRGNHQVVNAVRLQQDLSKIKQRLVNNKKPKDRALVREKRNRLCREMMEPKSHTAHSE